MSENTKQAAPFDAAYQAAVEQNIPCRVCGRVYAEHIRVGVTNPGWCNAYTPPMSNPPSHPSADALEAAKERLTRVVQGDALCEVYPRGTQPSDFHADISALLAALGSEGEDSKEPEMTEAEADAIWQKAERNPPSPESIQRVKDGVMRRLGFEPSAECETAWLIEADGPSWWTGRTTDRGAFDTDPNEAVRFARREDADRVKHWLLRDHAFALRTTEHMWLDAALSTPGDANGQ